MIQTQERPISHVQVPYQPVHKIRMVCATSLFDGHDAAINIMRRILQASGVEIIHLGHNRSAQEIVQCAIQEDVQGIAITSYQGGHLEFFKYIVDLLKEAQCSHIKVFGGGGGTILPQEVEELHGYGVSRIYTPDDGRYMGLQGMINDLIAQIDFPTGHIPSDDYLFRLQFKEEKLLGQLISAAENAPLDFEAFMAEMPETDTNAPVLGITGTGGAGKSSVVDELIRRFLNQYPNKRMAIISVDPSKRKTGGALLGDRIRMNTASDARIYMRSLATRQSNLALSKHVKQVIKLLQAAYFDLIILETSGIGQSDTEIVDHSDVALYVMTPEFGAATQLEKIDMLDYADLVAINKFDKRGAADALRDVRKQYKRNHQLWQTADEEMPVFGTMASQFNDPGINQLYTAMIGILNNRCNLGWELPSFTHTTRIPDQGLIPPSRVRYLSEISQTVRAYNQWVKEQADAAHKLQSIQTCISMMPTNDIAISSVSKLSQQWQEYLTPQNLRLLYGWEDKRNRYTADEYCYEVRGKQICILTSKQTLSHTRIPKVALPTFRGWGDILRWSLQENVPGEFPYTAGNFPFKREEEDPTRMFAGEGNPERTNKRFHYLSWGQPAKRLSTAFDSVTLYGEDPSPRPDVYGKIGNSGVSICCLDDAKRLYAGFDLSDPKTSVSMTINGPAATICAFFLNAAIDQQCEKYIIAEGLTKEVETKIAAYYSKKGIERPIYRGTLPEGNDGLGLMLLGITGDQVLPSDVYNRIKADTLKKVRGTVQADILKEDQAQNTCIFSTEFSLRLMGDMQQYFIDHQIRNFYSVSISGYHIAEAGANPITQLAFTLANGFTLLEYYLSRGMHVDDFAPNFSFFFSNGVDAEYAVIGRVARRIWAKALREKYHASERSQMLKYHIQTSGRSLHAQEIAFNDIRTTLQALYAIYDNCNSLHTNAYDEAITTPTEESVRRAMAIQLIINRELGLAMNENPLQGSFIIEELTDLVEEAVLSEFDRITERGGVLGAMETMYQRGKIQEESMHYETLKHEGALPIIGVNTFLSKDGSPTIIPDEVIRSTYEEKDGQISYLVQLHNTYQGESIGYLDMLKQHALEGNTFEALMQASKYCSLGQITHTLFEVGGQYRRNM